MTHFEKLENTSIEANDKTDSHGFSIWLTSVVDREAIISRKILSFCMHEAIFGDSKVLSRSLRLVSRILKEPSRISKVSFRNLTEPSRNSKVPSRSLKVVSRILTEPS